MSKDARELKTSSLKSISLDLQIAGLYIAYSRPADDKGLSLGKALSTSRKARSLGRSGGTSRVLI